MPTPSASGNWNKNCQLNMAPSSTSTSRECEHSPVHFRGVNPAWWRTPWWYWPNAQTPVSSVGDYLEINCFEQKKNFIRRSVDDFKRREHPPKAVDHELQRKQQKKGH